MEKNALEMNKILELLESYCVCENAKEMARTLEPKPSMTVVRESQSEITEAVAILQAGGQPPLSSQIAIRTAMDLIHRGGVLTPLQLHEAAHFLADAQKLAQFLKGRAESAHRLSLYGLSINGLESVKDDIASCVSQNLILDQASPELAKVRRRILILEDKIKDKLEKVLRNPAYKEAIQDSLISMREGRFVVPVKTSYKRQLEGQVLDRSSSGSTVFIEPEEVKRLQDELNLLRCDEEKICYKIQSELTNELAEVSATIMVNLDVMTHCDWVFARGKLARSMDATAPMMIEEVAIRLIEARHPLLGKAAVPLNLEMGVGFKGLIITGPNTGGKTVSMKTVGLLTHMAHCGLHIPAKPGTVIGQVKQILADIGDGQSISQNLSTFSSHMTNITEILKKADAHTLVLLDEVGSGTDPREGMGIAIAILESLYEKGSLVIASTHYGEIKTFGEQHPGFVNGSMSFDTESLKPLYKLSVGTAGESHGILIAKRLGMPESIIKRAQALSLLGTVPKGLSLEEYSNLTPLGTVPKVIKTLDLERILEPLETRESTITPPSETMSLLGTVPKVVKEIRPLAVGDVVKVPAMGLQGMVTEVANSKGEIEIAVRDKRIKIPQKRVQLYIEKENLYPEDYDMDVVLKSKDYRKKNKLINKGKGKGLVIES